MDKDFFLIISYNILDTVQAIANKYMTGQMSRIKQQNRLQAQIVQANQANAQAMIEIGIQPCVVAAFYHFTDLSDYKSLQTPLKEFCGAYQLKGTILLGM